MMSERVLLHYHHVVTCSVLTPCCPDYCLLLLPFDNNITIPFVWAGLCCTLLSAAQPQWKRKQCMRICLFLFFFVFVCFCSVLDFFLLYEIIIKLILTPHFACLVYSKVKDVCHGHWYCILLCNCLCLRYTLSPQDATKSHILFLPTQLCVMYQNSKHT